MIHKTIHKGKYYITIKRGFEDAKKDIIIIVDKVFETDTLRISLSSEEDPTFLYVLTISRNDYEDLKKQQGLLIDFDNFPSQLIRLLQQCAANNMFLILHQTNSLQYYFEVVEHNEFKRLVHLSLKTGPATDSDIKQHMADTIIHLKSTLANLKSSMSSSEAILNDKCVNLERKVHDLSHALTKQEEAKAKCETEYQEALKQEKEKLIQEKMQWQKTTEMNAKSQLLHVQENINRKDKQIDDLNTLCKQLRENIKHLENQLSEKSQRLNVLEQEVQKTHIEVATLKARNTTMEMELNEKDRQYNQVNSRCTYLEKIMKEDKDTIRELNSSLQIIKKEKTSLEERLALCESLVNKNNEAAHSTSEQLLKANQIISKQNSDLIEMKEKLLCRTAIALEQEKVIESNMKLIKDLKMEISNLKENLDKYNCDTIELQKKNEITEKALTDRDETIKNNNMVIQWLHKKLEETSVGSNRHSIDHTANSTPYFLPKTDRNNSTSDESINFYATSKLSSINESPQINMSEKNKGLDPKYLKPASDERVKKSKDLTKTASDVQISKGKENKHINLPHVNYREKKSSRTTDTYRATPVSAYFPR